MDQNEAGRWWRAAVAWALVTGALGAWLLWPRPEAAAEAVEDEVVWG